jgi:hypothetical protein
VVFVNLAALRDSGLFEHTLIQSLSLRRLIIAARSSVATHQGEDAIGRARRESPPTAGA